MALPLRRQGTPICRVRSPKLSPLYNLQLVVTGQNRFLQPGEFLPSCGRLSVFP